LLKLDPAIVIPGKSALKDLLHAEENLTTDESRSDHGCQYAGNINR